MATVMASVRVCPVRSTGRIGVISLAASARLSGIQGAGKADDQATAAPHMWPVLSLIPATLPAILAE
jgi:hypothetical protein